MIVVSNNINPARQEKLTTVKSPVMGRLIVQSAGKLLLLKFNDIVYCQASSNYTMIHMVKGNQILVSKCLKEVMKGLPKTQFVRIHQSYLVNLSVVAAIGSNEIDLYDSSSSLPLSRRYKKSLRARFQTFY